jgi:hypothetical protein
MADAGPVDADYVEWMRGQVHGLVRLDQQHGGALASPVILRAYRRMKHHVSTSGVRGGLRRDACSALAEVAEVAGWSLLDAGQDLLARKVNGEALRLARVAGDRGMGLFVLQNMALHAERLGWPRWSLDVSRFVLDRGRLSPRVEVLFRLRLARSFALLRAEGDARRELGRARGLFSDGVRDDDPHWSWWVDEGQLSWFEGAVRLDLGRRSESVGYLEAAAGAVPEPRMNFLYRCWALYGYAVNRAWEDVDRALREVFEDVGVYRSRPAEVRILAALDLVEVGGASAGVRDVARATRLRLRDVGPAVVGS